MHARSPMQGNCDFVGYVQYGLSLRLVIYHNDQHSVFFVKEEYVVGHLLRCFLHS